MKRTRVTWPSLLVLWAGTTLASCAAYVPAPFPHGLAPDPSSESLNQSIAERYGHQGNSVPIDLSRALTPDQLSLIAVISNPDLRAQRARLGVTEAQVFEAGLLPDPQFSFSLDHPGAGPGLVDALAAGLGMDVSAIYTRPQILRGARATDKQVRLDLAWLEWQTANQARLLAARVNGLQATLAAADEAHNLSSSILDRTLRAVARGDLSASDLETRRIGEADAGDRVRTVERDLQTARIALNTTLGLSPEVSVALAAPVAPPACLPPTGYLLEEAIALRPDLVALRAGYDAQDANVRIALLRQYPRLNLSLNAARDTGAIRTNGVALGFDIPLWNRNRGQIAVQNATREQLRAEYTARLFSTRSDLATLVSAYDIGKRQRADLARQVLPLRLTVAAFERASARGDIATITSETARLTLLDKEFALASIDQGLAEQWSAIQLATGRVLKENECDE
ncbi:MAG: TolC family protein [Brevundimonas sp.]